MTAQDKTKEQLLDEIKEMRQRITELEAAKVNLHGSHSHDQSTSTRGHLEWAYGLSHKLNDLFQIILGNAGSGLFNSGLTKYTEVESNLEQILEACRSGAALVRRLQYFTGVARDEGREDRKVFNLSLLIRQAVELGQYWWSIKPDLEGREILLTKNILDGCLVEGDENQLFEVLINLIRNSAEALPCGGEISIDMELRADKAILRVSGTATDFAQGNVGGTCGPFEPTKKSQRSETEFGIYQDLIRQHGGELSLKAGDAEGLVFTLELPTIIRTMEPKKAETKSPMEPNRRILVVDDEPFIAQLLERRLINEGQTVFTAASGAEAIEVFDQTPIDLVISDLVMPGMEGWQLARRIREICREKGIPKTPFILLTARHRRVRGEEKMIDHGVDAILDKPIEFGGLLEVVRRLLRKGRHDENCG